ncbi:MAG: hypothetical protein ABI415_01420 [Flavitalea sp.]
MAKKKTGTSTESSAAKTLFEKIGEQATHLKEELITGKDHFVEFAGEKIASVKSSIKDFKKRNSKPAKKKAAKKAPAKKVAKKKSAKPLAKKRSTASKGAKKAAPKKAAKKKSSKR